MAAMSEASLSAILNSIPEKSRVSYVKAWNEFQLYRTTVVPEKTKGGPPNVDDYISYFTHLRNVKKYKGTSLWSTYSRLNSVHSRLYQSKLQKWPSLTQALKGFQSGESNKKKCNIFTTEQLESFISNVDLDEDKYWLTRKAVVILAFFGGHRCAELRDVNMEDVTKTEEGFYVTYKSAKQLGQVVKVKKYLVPKAKTLPTDNSRCWASVLNKYMEALHQDLNESTGPLFRTTKNTKFHTLPMGINKLYDVGKELAILLKLPNSEGFTRHCFALSAATEATETYRNRKYDLRQHFNGKSEQMELEDIDNSKAQTKKMEHLPKGIAADNSKAQTKKMEHLPKDIAADNSKAQTKKMEHLPEAAIPGKAKEAEDAKKLADLGKLVAQLQQEILQLKAQVETKVYFDVVRRQETSPGYLTYTDVLANAGNAMDQTTGVFTAPVFGTYMFTFSGTSGGNHGSWFNVNIMKNGFAIEAICEGNQAGNLNHVAHIWHMVLRAGDKIHLCLTDGTLQLNLHYNLHFTGHLIDPYMKR